MKQQDLSLVNNRSRLERDQATHEGVECGQVNHERRRMLVAATSVAGGLCAAVASVTFIVSMLPSDRARAEGAPVEVDIDKLEPEQLMTVAWQRKPVWILRRTSGMTRSLGANSCLQNDPESRALNQPAYCRNMTRSIRPEYFVSVGICTHLGCVPSFRPEVAPADLGQSWPGGFFCPCHGSKFDLAGRVFKNVPAPTNLVIPPHGYISDPRLLIGAET